MNNNQLLWKEMDGTRTYFFYADEGLVAEYDESGNVIRAYGYQPDSMWTTDPLWLRQNGQYYWYQNDHLGTPQKLIDINGTVVWSAQYTAFGNAQVQVETVTNNLRFPGQYYDAETGLHYNWFRYYDPGIGRYLKVDPIGFLGGDVNLYPYVWNDPANWVDPKGLQKKKGRRFETKGKKATGEYNTIGCDGKGNVIPLLLHLPDGWEHECVKNCVEAHELSHKEDCDNLSPNVCREGEKPDGKPKPKGLEVFEIVTDDFLKSVDWMDIGECKAHVISLDCVKRKLKNPKCTETKEVLQDLERLMKDHLRGCPSRYIYEIMRQHRLNSVDPEELGLSKK